MGKKVVGDEICGGAGEEGCDFPFSLLFCCCCFLYSIPSFLFSYFFIYFWYLAVGFEGMRFVTLSIGRKRRGDDSGSAWALARTTEMVCATLVVSYKVTRLQMVGKNKCAKCRRLMHISHILGANDFGQLGDGTEERRKHPKKVKQLESEFVKSVSCGAHYSDCIAEPRENDGTISTGRLWVWGQNQGSNLPRLFWGAFEPNTIIWQVSCGSVHVVALSEEGLLQAWGYNEYGQLGRGVTCEGLQGARIINSYAKFLDEAPELVKITKVSCGEYHTAAISDKGEVYTWGLGNMGQLGHSSLQYGDKELLPRRVVSLDGIFIKDVACGGVHTCAITQEGALYAWGGGQFGQLGLGPHTGLFSCVANDSQTFFRNIPVLVVPKDVRLVACGHSHTLIYMRDGRIHGWGYNSYGQAANEKSTYAWYPSPVDWCVGEVRKLAAGGGHSAVLTDAYSLKELCEFVLADCMTLSNAAKVEDIAYRTGSDSLARLCGRLREYMLAGGAHGQDEERNSKI